ncbi:unnamed protein product, partial [Choristocarpus tenellus]
MGGAAMSWAYARAALVLRTEALATAVAWVDSAGIIQVAFRGFRCRNAYKTFHRRRGHAATMLQCLHRRSTAMAIARELRDQMHSEWEQLWDEEEEMFYYFHKCTVPLLSPTHYVYQKTMESQWENPLVPFRPMIRDRLSARLMQAWPQLEDDGFEARNEAEPGFCMKCKIERATRVCDQCVHKDKFSWHQGRWHFCFACF